MLIAETDRLIIREFELEDAEDFLALESNPVVQKYTGDVILNTLEEVRNRIISQKEDNYKRFGKGRWTVVFKPDNKVVGWAGLKYLEQFDLVDLGYRFIPEYWGKGIATEASLAIIDYGFNVLGLKQIVGIAMSGNTASIKVLKKVGMTFDKYAPYDEGGEDVEWYSINASNS